MLSFFLNLYILRFSFLLFNITSFLNLLFLSQTDVVGCMLLRLIFCTWRDFIFSSRLTTFSATTFLIGLQFSPVVLFLMLLQLLICFVLRVRISYSRALMVLSSIPVDTLWSMLLQTSLSLLSWLQRDRWSCNFIPSGYFFDFLYANNNCLCLDGFAQLSFDPK